MKEFSADFIWKQLEQNGELLIETEAPEDTFELGKCLGAAAEAGQVYTLLGDLGVGKTVFTQALRRGLGLQCR